MKPITVALVASLCLVAGCGRTPSGQPYEAREDDLRNASAARDELFTAIDATRSLGSGRFGLIGPSTALAGTFDENGAELTASGNVRVRVVDGRVYLPTANVARAGDEVATEWVSLALDDLSPLQDRRPGLTDEILAVAGAAPPGPGAVLAALRTASRVTGDGTRFRARLNLSAVDRLAPRDRDAVVAWTRRWVENGGRRKVMSTVTVDADGVIRHAVIAPRRRMPPPLKLSLDNLGAPIGIAVPTASSVTEWS